MSTSPGIRMDRTFRNTQIQEIIDCVSLKVKTLGKGIFFHLGKNTPVSLVLPIIAVLPTLTCLACFVVNIKLTYSLTVSPLNS